MTGIIVATHGRYADGILSAMELIAGAQAGVVGVNYEIGQGTDELKAAMEAKMDALEADAVLFMTDLAGGSPYNVASLFSDGYKDKTIRVISGVNLPMLLEGALTKDMMDIDALVLAAAEAAKNGVQIFEKKQSKKCKTEIEEDGI